MKDLFAGMQIWFSKAFNLPVLKENRWPWVDYLRGIAIILVVYRHVLIGIERSGISIPVSLVDANMIFFSFRMPLFFILSGIFINSSIAKRTIKQLIFIKFENLLYPYLIWSFLQITVQILFSNFTNANRSLIDYTYILYQPRNLDQFWYLPALFNTTIIYILIKTKLKAPIWLQFIFGLIFYFLSPYILDISMISDWMQFYIFFALGDAISKFFFKDSTQRFLKRELTFLFIIPIFILTQIYYLNYNIGQLEFLLIALIGCLSMFVVAFQMQRWNILAILRVFGYHSLYIYVMHVFAAAFARIIMEHLLGIYDPVILLITGIFFGITIPVIFYNLLIKDNILWFLFSLRKRHEKQLPAKKWPQGQLHPEK
jgi:fucose 4-O-acetylase-like acetyltransferase